MNRFNAERNFPPLRKTTSVSLNRCFIGVGLLFMLISLLMISSSNAQSLSCSNTEMLDEVNRVTNPMMYTPQVQFDDYVTHKVDLLNCTKEIWNHTTIVKDYFSTYSDACAFSATAEYTSYAHDPCCSTSAPGCCIPRLVQYTTPRAAFSSEFNATCSFDVVPTVSRIFDKEFRWKRKSACSAITTFIATERAKLVLADTKCVSFSAAEVATCLTTLPNLANAYKWALNRVYGVSGTDYTTTVSSNMFGDSCYYNRNGAIMPLYASLQDLCTCSFSCTACPFDDCSSSTSVCSYCEKGNCKTQTETITGDKLNQTSCTSNSVCVQPTGQHTVQKAGTCGTYCSLSCPTCNTEAGCKAHRQCDGFPINSTGVMCTLPKLPECGGCPSHCDLNTVLNLCVCNGSVDAPLSHDVTRNVFPNPPPTRANTVCKTGYWEITDAACLHFTKCLLADGKTTSNLPKDECLKCRGNKVISAFSFVNGEWSNVTSYPLSWGSPASATIDLTYTWKRGFLSERMENVRLAVLDYMYPGLMDGRMNCFVDAERASLQTVSCSCNSRSGNTCKSNQVRFVDSVIPFVPSSLKYLTPPLTQDLVSGYVKIDSVTASQFKLVQLFSTALIGSSNKNVYGGNGTVVVGTVSENGVSSDTPLLNVSLCLMTFNSTMKGFAKLQGQILREVVTNYTISGGAMCATVNLDSNSTFFPFESVDAIPYVPVNVSTNATTCATYGTLPAQNITQPPTNNGNKNSTLPSNTTQIPPVNNNNSTKPQNTTQPPVNNSTLPSNTTQPPISNNTLPSNNNNSTKPQNTTQPPVNNSTLPSNTTQPPINNNNSTKPQNTTQPPLNNSTLPSNTTQPPIGNNGTLPSNNTQIPPINNTTKPQNTTQPPVNNSTLPSNTTQPGNNGTLPSNNTVTPPPISNNSSNTVSNNSQSSFTCFGILPQSTSVCKGKGQCLGPNICKCTIGKTGEQCEKSVCFGKTEGVGSCNNNGQCIDTDRCRCNNNFAGKECSECSPGFTGTKCDKFVCFGIPQDSAFVCSGRGKCVSNNTCQCVLGAVGLKCEQFTCFTTTQDGGTTNSTNPPLNSTNPINPSVNGTVSPPVNNTNQSNNQTNPQGPPATNSTNPSLANSTNLQPPVNNSTLPSNTTQIPPLNNNNSTKPHNTTQPPVNNNTLPSNTTEIQETEQPENSTLPSNTTQIPPINNNNTTKPQNTTQPPITNNNETLPVNNTNLQGNNSIAGGNNQTNLQSRQIRFVSGIAAVSTTCSGNGLCIGPNLCKCFSDTSNGFWEGQKCERCQPNYGGLNCKEKRCDPAITCSGRGSCNSDSTCNCGGGFAAPFCLSCQPGLSGTFCNTTCIPTRDCSGNGECLSDGSCLCSSDQRIGMFQGSKCNQCKQGWFGSRCNVFVGEAASFGINGDRISLTFAYPSNEMQIGCGVILTQDSLNAVGGSDAKCQWTDKATNQFLIVFGRTSTLTPGNSLTLLGTDGKTFTIPALIGSLVYSSPTISLRCPPKVSRCSSFYIDAVASSQDRKPLKFVWSFVSAPVSVNQLNYLTNTSAPQLLVKPNDMSYGTYVVSCTGISTSSNLSSTAFISFEVSATAAPMISIPGGTEQTFVMNRPITVIPRIDFPGCYFSDRTLIYNWTQTTGTQVSFTKMDNGKSLFISNKDIFIPGTYSFNFVATSAVDKNSFSSVSVSLLVQATPLNLRVAGGTSRTVFIGDSLVIDATKSFDPSGTKETEEFSFSCVSLESGESCGLNNTSSFSSKKQYTIPPNTLTQGNYMFSIYFVKGDRSASAVILVKYEATAVVPVEIRMLRNDLIPMSIPMGVDVALMGFTTAKNMTWSSTTDGFSLSLTNTNTPTLNGPALVIKKSALTPGVTYVIRLSAYEGSKSGFSEFSLAINEPPTAGSLSVSPSSIIAGTDVVTLTCSDFSDYDVPLSYQFFFLDENRGPNAWTPISQRINGNSLNTKLPKGFTNNKLHLKAKVFDSKDGFTEILSSIVSSPPTVVTNEQKQNFINQTVLDVSDPAGAIVSLQAFSSFANTDPSLNQKIDQFTNQLMNQPDIFAPKSVEFVLQSLSIASTASSNVGKLSTDNKALLLKSISNCVSLFANSSSPIDDEIASSIGSTLSTMASDILVSGVKSRRNILSTTQTNAQLVYSNADTLQTTVLQGMVTNQVASISGSTDMLLYSRKVDPSTISSMDEIISGNCKFKMSSGIALNLTGYDSIDVRVKQFSNVYQYMYANVKNISSQIFEMEFRNGGKTIHAHGPLTLGVDGTFDTAKSYDCNIWDSTNLKFVNDTSCVPSISSSSATLQVQQTGTYALSVRTISSPTTPTVPQASNTTTTVQPVKSAVLSGSGGTSGLSTDAIIAIAVSIGGSLVLVTVLVIVVLIIVCVMRKNKTKTHPQMG